MKRALCEESILRIFDVLWQEKVCFLNGAKTDVVICPCKVFKKALLEGFPTEEK